MAFFLGSFTVLSSWYMWAKQFAALFCVRCSFCDLMTVCRFSVLSSFSSLVILQSFVVSFSILRDAFFSCHAVLVWWSLCRVNSALALFWFSTFASAGSCSCAILAWLTASCNSCSWLFHPGVYCSRLPRGIYFLAASRMASVINWVSLLRWCWSRLIFLQFSSASFWKTSQFAFLKFQLGLW